MAKIDRVQEVSTELLVPYANNAKKHSKEQVDKIAESIRSFGFLSPCLIDNDYNIIAGHGRVMAALQMGLPTVPCVFIDGLSEAERRAYILADNRLTELGDWDFDKVQFELEELNDMNFDVELTGFEVAGGDEWFENRRRYDNDLDGESEEYKDFVAKFEPKKTTDDCYTPDGIYDVIASWVEKEYGVNREDFVRPFYPNGDYQKEEYPDGCVVVDNPPFSIMAETVRWYTDHNVKFFLFCPSLTGLSPIQAERATMICTNADITYENGATVATSFTTNLENGVVVRTAPDLHEIIEEKNKEIRQEMRVELPKYTYPASVVTMAIMGMWADLGINFKVLKGQCVRVAELDAQKEQGKAIYGGGLLLSEKARIEAEKARIEAEKARIEAEKRKPRIEWTLSDRELAIIEQMG